MRKKVKGFSLIELIVTIAIIAIVTVIIFSIFDFGNKAYSMGGSQFDLQSSGRLASDIIRNKVRYASELVIETSFDPALTDDNYNYIYISDNSEEILFKEGANAPVSIANTGSSKVKYSITFKKDSITSEAIRFSETIPSSPSSEKLLNYKITMTSSNGKVYSIENEVTLMNSTYIALTPPAISGPTALPDEGVVAPNTSVTLTSAVGGEIYFTLDGTVPTSSSMMYTSPIIITSSVNLKAIVIKDSQSSLVASYNYNVSLNPVVSGITFTKVNGTGKIPDKITVSYTYNSPVGNSQGNTQIQWFEKQGNSFIKLNFDGQVTIDISKNATYRVVITPWDNLATPNIGNPVTAEYVNKNN